MNAFTVLRLDHVVLRVKELERSVCFYSEVIGCQVVRRRDDLGLVHMRAGDSMIDLMWLQGPLGRRGGVGAKQDGRNVDHVCLRVEPFDQDTILKEMSRLAVAVVDTATSNFGAEGDGPSIYIADPDGNVIELKGPASTLAL